MKAERSWQKLLFDIVKREISDVHFLERPEGFFCQVRDKEGLHDYPHAGKDLCLYLCWLSGLDLWDQTKPQSKAFSYVYLNATYHFRFSVLNSHHTASYVLRILYTHYLSEKLSLLEEQNRHFENCLKEKNGLILLGGSTGSGKTSSAYSLLRKMENRRIYSLEDPVEMKLENVIQLEINPLLGLNYAEGIRQLMRHDPDVLFIGEIRNEEEAKMSVRAALTGHLVLSTIHAFSASGILERLEDLQVNRKEAARVLISMSCQELIIRGKERVCLYEIMDKEEIRIYLQTGKNSPRFLSLEAQKKEGESGGI